MKRFIAALLFVTACAGSTEVIYRSSLPSTVSMVEVRPGVYAVADQDEPVFYTDNFYWRYRDNGWYRTTGESDEWIRIGRPPEVVLSIREPQRYQRYRPTSRDAIVIRDQHGRFHRR